MKPRVLSTKEQAEKADRAAGSWAASCPHHELLGRMKRPRNPADVANKHHWPQRKALKQQHSSHNCQTKKINVHNDSGDPTPQLALQVGCKMYNSNNKILLEFEKGWMSELTYMRDWKRLNCRGDDQVSERWEEMNFAMPTGQVAKLFDSIACDDARLAICWDAWALMMNCMHANRNCVVGPHAHSIQVLVQGGPTTHFLRYYHTIIEDYTLLSN